MGFAVHLHASYPVLRSSPRALLSLPIGVFAGRLPRELWLRAGLDYLAPPPLDDAPAEAEALRPPQREPGWPLAVATNHRGCLGRASAEK